MRVLKRIILVTFLVFTAWNCESVFATINPNNYSINFSIQNQNQAITLPGLLEADVYASTMRTISVSTNAPSGYKIYVDVPTNESTGGSLTLVGGDSSSPSVSPINTTPATASTLGADTWGFGIPNTTTGLPTNNYSASYTAGTPSSSSTYAGVKVSPTRTLI